MSNVMNFFQKISDFMNNDEDASKLIAGIDFSAAIDLGGKNCNIIISGGKSTFLETKKANADITLLADEEAMEKIASGELDSALAFLSGDMEVEGDFDRLLDLLEVIELAYEKLDIAKGKELLVDAKTLRKLMNVYNAGGENIDPADIPLFFKIFCAFANNNPDAQDVIEDENLRVQMVVKEVGTFVLMSEDGKLSWSDKKIDDPILEFELAIKTAADVLLGGDAASAYLSGEVTATGNIAQALLLQELLEIFLELMPFMD